MNALRKFPHIEIFYDVVSPYSYLAFIALYRYQKTYNLNVTYRPLFLGGLMASVGNKPPGELPAKKVYMLNDLDRLAKYFDVPRLILPSNFPVNTVNVQRVLTYLWMNEDPLQPELALKLWNLFWQQQKNIASPELLKEALLSFGLSNDQIAHILEQANSDQVKEKLKASTQEAKDRGAFGAPTIFVHHTAEKEDMYFGSDRFHLIFPSIGIKWDGPSPMPHKL